MKTPEIKIVNKIQNGMFVLENTDERENYDSLIGFEFLYENKKNRIIGIGSYAHGGIRRKGDRVMVITEEID